MWGWSFVWSFVLHFGTLPEVPSVEKGARDFDHIGRFDRTVDNLPKGYFAFSLSSDVQLAQLGIRDTSPLQDGVPTLTTHGTHRTVQLRCISMHGKRKNYMAFFREMTADHHSKVVRSCSMSGYFDKWIA